ncbi:MAG: TolB family protein [Candidatus Hodarchaeota archaeon]
MKNIQKKSILPRILFPFILLLVLCFGEVSQGIVTSGEESINIQTENEPIRLSQDAPEEEWFSDSPTLVVDSQNRIHVVWCDEQAAPFHYEYISFRDLYYKSFNGSKWSINQQITFGNGTSYSPVLAVDASDMLHLVWQDTRHIQSEIYYKFYDGQSWSPEYRLTTSSDHSLNPTIVVDFQNVVHVFWHEGTEDGGFRIFYIKNDGTGWSEALQLTNISFITKNPTVAIDSQNTLYLVWVDERDGNKELYYKSYHADQWGPAQRLTVTDSNSESPLLLVDFNDNLHLIWLEKTKIFPFTNHIYYKRYEGMEWTVEQQLTREPPEPPEELPLMAYAERPDRLSAVCDSFNRIHLVWQDERGRRREIFYMGLVGWVWSLDTPLTSDDGSDSVSPAIGVDRNNTVHVIWSDHRHAEHATGNTEIYYQVRKIPIVTVSRPKVTYYAETETIDIIGVIATSNTPTVDTLNPSETQINYYRIYNYSEAFTGLSGNMTWTGNSWEAANIDVSSLGLGEYYVRCFFADTQAFGVSYPSELFNIKPAPLFTTSTSPLIEEYPRIYLLSTIVAAPLILYRKIRRKSSQENPL